VLANAPALAMTAGVADHLLRPPVNLVRLSLHPDGLAPRIVNFAEMAAHIVTRLRRQLAITGDAELGALVDEATTYVPADAAHDAHDPLVVLPLRLDVGGRVLSFFSTIATFGTAVDVTIAELSIETMYPADDATAAALRNGWMSADDGDRGPADAPPTRLSRSLSARAERHPSPAARSEGRCGRVGGRAEPTPGPPR
jgi:hypothetical protein